MRAFWAISEKLNTLLYRREMEKISSSDAQLAIDWTLEMIRSSHPHWDEARVQRYYENLLHLKVVAVDQFIRRMQ